MCPPCPAGEALPGPGSQRPREDALAADPLADDSAEIEQAAGGRARARHSDPSGWGQPLRILATSARRPQHMAGLRAADGPCLKLRTALRSGLRLGGNRHDETAQRPMTVAIATTDED